MAPWVLLPSPGGSHHCHLPHAPVGPTKVTQGGRTPTTCQPSPYIPLLSLGESYCHRLPYIPIVHIAVTRTGPPLSPALCPYGSHCCHPEGSIPLPPPARCPHRSLCHHLPAVPVGPTSMAYTDPAVTSVIAATSGPPITAASCPPQQVHGVLVGFGGTGTGHRHPA